MVTLVGIPVAIIAMLLWAIFLYLSKILAAMVIGKLITDAFKWKKLSLWVSFLIGLAVVSLASLTPIVGWLAVWVACMWAFGVGAKMDMEMIGKWR